LPTGHRFVFEPVRAQGRVRYFVAAVVIAAPGCVAAGKPYRLMVDTGATGSIALAEDVRAPDVLPYLRHGRFLDVTDRALFMPVFAAQLAMRDDAGELVAFPVTGLGVFPRPESEMGGCHGLLGLDVLTR
jgi:hypothetical protein